MLAILCVAVAAFVPPAPLTKTTSLSAYVPAGLSKAEWDKQKKADAAKDQKNKNRFPKNKSIVSMDSWMKTLENKQQLKGAKIVNSGHTYAKVKYTSKDEYDRAKGKK